MKAGYRLLNEVQSAEVALLYRAGATMRELGHKFGCSPQLIQHTLVRAGEERRGHGSFGVATPHSESLLQSARLQMGLRQRDLAARAGVTQPYISQLECGTYYGSALPASGVLERLADALNIDAHDLRTDLENRCVTRT